MKIAITNNPMVLDRVLEGTLPQFTIEFCETDYLGVLKAARDKVHLGHSLLTHPLSGSVKPWETPYKTVIISGEKGPLDAASLNIIEGSLQSCLKMAASGKGKRDAKALSDFRLIDYSLVFGGLS